MKKIFQKLIGNSGVITIEFSFVYIIFFAFVLIIFETCRFFFVVVAIDYSLSEAARNSSYIENKTSDADFKKVFNDYFFKENSFWVMFIEPKDIQIDASFCTGVREIINYRCSSVYNKDRRIALYSVNYKYRPMKIISNSKWADSMFSLLDDFLTRKVVYMIESTR